MADESNAQAIEELIRRTKRVRRWRLFFLLLMTVGSIAPCSLAIWLPKNLPSSVGEYFGMAAFGSLVIGFGGFVLMYGDTSKYFRLLCVAVEAEKLGLRYIEKPPKKILNRLHGTRMFADANDVVGVDYCKGSKSGRDIALISFTTIYRTMIDHKAAQINSQTVILVKDAAPEIPDFCIVPRSWLNALMNAFNSNIVKLTGEKEFNRNFLLWSVSPDEITNVFSPEAIELFLEADAIVELHQGDLIVYRHQKTAPPGDFRNIIKQATAIVAVLEG